MLKYANGLRKKSYLCFQNRITFPIEFFNMSLILTFLFVLIFLAELLKEKR